MKAFQWMTVVVLVPLLGACAAPRQAVDFRGVSFPVLEASYLKTGDFIDPNAATRRVTPGLNRDQVRLLLGNPHFNEGIFSPDEWNYVFSLYTGAENEYRICQYQVQYGDDDKGREGVKAIYWQTPDCERLSERGTNVAAALSAPTVTTVSLTDDLLFVFGRSSEGDLNPSGRVALEQFAQHWRSHYDQIYKVIVVGHADPIGAQARNYFLSQDRALTVSEILIRNGIGREVIVAIGKGSTETVADCSEGQGLTPEQVQCLQPDRRVSVTVLAAAR